MPKYSICMTHRNNTNTIEPSLNSILAQTDEDFEVIVVDAKSTDGSLKKLRRYSEEGKIKLIVNKCSRGKGRQLAFEASSGQYIIANMDLDEIYRPRLRELLRLYHAKCEGSVLLAVYDATKELRGIQNVTIAPSTVAKEIGGWHDLQYSEDWEFWARAAKANKYAWAVLPLVESINLHEERSSIVNKVRFRIIRYREAMRCGRPVFNVNEVRTPKQRIFLLLVASILPFYESYQDPYNRVFDSYGKSYRIQFDRANSEDRR